MKLVSFNIRYIYSGEPDGINAFVHRAGLILDKIDREKPDIICFQEASDQISAFLRKHLKEYICTGHGRDADLTGEAMLTAVRKETFAPIKSRVFWLSPTPTVPGSDFPGQNCCKRICNLTEVREFSSGKKAKIYNTHFDYEKDGIRLKEAEVIREDIERELANDPAPTFLLGDLNCPPDSAPVAHILGTVGAEFIDLAKDFTQTFHAFGKPDSVSYEFRKIDYIFANKNTPAATSLWDDCSYGVWLSDHFPVCAEFNF